VLVGEIIISELNSPKIFGRRIIFHDDGGGQGTESGSPSRNFPSSAKVR